MSRLVRVGGGSQGRTAPALGLITQAELGLRIRSRFGVEYDRSRIARCLAGVHATIEMLEQISEVLDISSPIYAARDEEEAGRLRQQRSITKQLEAARAEATRGGERVRQAEAALDAEMARMENDVRIKRAQRGDQGGVVNPVGEEDQRGGRSRGGVGKRGRSAPS